MVERGGPPCEGHRRTWPLSAHPRRASNRSAFGSCAPSPHHGLCRRDLRVGMDALRGRLEVEPRPPSRYGGDSCFDARVGARLPEASAVPDLARGVVVYGLSAGRLGLLSAGRRLAWVRPLSVFCARGRMARWPKACVGAFPARRYSVLQFPGAEVRPQCSASVRCGPSRPWHSCARSTPVATGGASSPVSAPQLRCSPNTGRCFWCWRSQLPPSLTKSRGLFPLAGALGGCIGGDARLRAPHRLARTKGFSPAPLCAGTRAAQSFPDWLRSVAEY